MTCTGPGWHNDISDTLWQATANGQCTIRHYIVLCLNWVISHRGGSDDINVPDVRAQIHGLLLERKLSAWYIHPAGEHCLKRQEWHVQAGVDRYIIHEASLNCSCGHVTWWRPWNGNRYSWFETKLFKENRISIICRLLLIRNRNISVGRETFQVEILVVISNSYFNPAPPASVRIDSSRFGWGKTCWTLQRITVLGGSVT